ncbi:MAG: type 1 glutamine amidotransferase [Candidatus Micrarchaeota archaeon]
MAVRIAIINCASREQETFSEGGKSYTASALLAKKIAEFGESSGVRFAVRIYRPPEGPADFPKMDEFDAAIIPGSKHDIDEEGRKANPWMENLLDFIREAHSRKKPMLGICFGHQAIAVAFGSGITRMQKGEIGFVPAELTAEGGQDILLRGVPKKFDSMQFHFCFVEPLPEGAAALAWGTAPKILQAFRIGGTTWGVQFHPDYSPENVSEAIGRRREALSKSADVGSIRLETGRRTDDLALKNFLAFLALRSG